MNPLSEIIDIYYFSGTGNTIQVCREMKQVFDENGIKTNLYPLEKSSNQKIDNSHTIGIAFPCAIHTTYPIVREWIETIPNHIGMKVFFVCTMGGTRTGINNYIQGLLKKGMKFEVLAIENIAMVRNFCQKDFPKDFVEKKNTKAFEHARKFAKSLLMGKKPFGKKDALSWFFNPIANTEWVWNLTRKYYPLVADLEKCNGCKICEKICPVGNITFSEKKSPTFGTEKCQVCLRCVGFCPQKAINRDKKKKFAIYRIGKAKQFL